MNEILQTISTLWQDIISHPGTSLAIIGNLIIIESLLSVDNAAVLATMVMDLPKEQRNRALKFGIWGAYIFRGIAMIFASALITIWWLKPIGGLYLLYLVFDWYKSKQTKTEEDDTIDKESNWLYKLTVGSLGNFWATVCLVELMDMAFSIDNVFAAVAFTPNIILVCIGVFIGILAMRFIAQWFVNLMEKYPFLETAAFIVIGILGLKLTLSLIEHFYPESEVSEFLGSHAADIGISVLTVAIFFIPIITCLLFNVPKKHTGTEE
ncbi:membrane protein [Flavobacterium rivuli WB 3.3-2 = DSM 21788]|uniref:Membrane protein n=1 Tax=Flavobacterium rivuli WB 3.3-2 = DSM 21788 TaxID=1121895 RepID=A0A0A2M4T8_9FLAO|nr:TerC family protein [Flavobacterium rivuli]KGO86616.1 membrane protein [Flavobacterium rivuli WB 3.3-2 = DSM 21788]